MRERPVLAAFAVALVAGLAHTEALGGGFTFDDHAIVESNPRLAVHDLAGLRELLGSHYWGPASERTGERLYRPVPLATYALEQALAGGPSGRLSHATNVLLHALAAVLALVLFRTLVAERAALLGALLFAAHPLHAEAVAGVVGRAEVLALAGGLASLILHVRARGRGGAVAEGLALFLALGSKESAVAAIPIAVALDLVREGKLAPRRFVAPLVGLVAYVGVRSLAIGALVAESSARTLGAMPLAERALYALAVLRDAWRDVLWPVHGTAAHFPLPDVSGAGLVVAAVVQLGMLGTAWVLFRDRTFRLAFERESPTARGVALGIVGFELALGPVLNLVPIGVVYAERLLYAPTLWASLVVGALASRLARGPAGALAAGLLVGALVLASNHNDAPWHDDLSLWKATAARFPEEPRARQALGECQLESGRHLDEARENLRFAVEQWPDSQPLKAKALVLLAQARRAAAPRDPRAHEEAERDFARALVLQPGRAESWQMRADARLHDDEPELAIPDARRACELAPESYDARALLGFALLRRDDFAAATSALTSALPLTPFPGEALFNRADARWALGDRAGAAEDYVRAAECLVAKGRRGEAVGAFVAGGRLDRLPMPDRARVARLLER